ncbi:pyocin activator PrtN family protein [Aliiroseovarius sp.]|uniref:pyocin activator PrtN family protein n=1 Tax=Aliiroseovarius sp. TaxID=1872442 RepID=UPI00343FE17C
MSPIRIPYFNLEDKSQKAQKFVMLRDIAQLIDIQFFSARERFSSIWSEAERI